MVIQCACVGMVSPTLLLAEKAVEPVLERLDPPRRAIVVMALLGLVLTGLLLVTFAMLGGHWVRRLARQRPAGRDGGAAGGAARNRALRESLEAMLPQENTGETVHFDIGSKDTKVEP